MSGRLSGSCQAENSRRTVMEIQDRTHLMGPFVAGATALFGGLAILELMSRGQIRSVDNSADIYLALLGAYAGTGELKRWLTKDTNPEDPWIQRAQKGEFFVA